MEIQEATLSITSIMLPQGNVFTPVCHSVHRGAVCLSAGWDTHTPWQTPPGQTSPWADTPWVDTPWTDLPARHPPGQILPSRRLLQRTVRILLECILVKSVFYWPQLWNSGKHTVTQQSFMKVKAVQRTLKIHSHP